MVSLTDVFKLTFPFNFIGFFFIYFGIVHEDIFHLEFGLVWLIIALFAGMVRNDKVEKNTKEMLLRIGAFFIPIYFVFYSPLNDTSKSPQTRKLWKFIISGFVVYIGVIVYHVL